MQKMNQTGTSGERIAGLDFVRFAATVGVFLYHFGCISKCAWAQPFKYYTNGQWGATWVGLFFMLSGALLYHRSREGFSPAAFYRKRWRAIYPEFWLAFAVCFAKNALQAHKFFYKGNPPALLLSLLCLDGYFLYRIPNYYIIGEWFLGAILLIYLLYPLLRRAFLRIPHLLCALLLAACVIVERTGFFAIAFSRNLIVCIFEFTLGMLLMRHRERLTGAPLTVACLLIEILLLAIPLPLRTPFYAILHALALYLLLGKLGAWIEAKARGLHAVVRFGAAHSYSIFLTHHILISNVAQLWNPSAPVACLAALLICAAATLATAVVLHFIAQWLVSRLSRERSATPAA